MIDVAKYIGFPNNSTQNQRLQSNHAPLGNVTQPVLLGLMGFKFNSKQSFSLLRFLGFGIQKRDSFTKTPLSVLFYVPTLLR